MSSASTLVQPHRAAFAAVPPVGRLPLGTLMETVRGHRCRFRYSCDGRAWACGHNFVIQPRDECAARARAAGPSARAGEAQAAPGGTSTAAPALTAPETPACAQNAHHAAGGRSGASS